MSLYFRRLYATLPKAPAAVSSAVARTSSTPLQVRRRRQRTQPSLPPGIPDTTSSGLSPSEKQRYERLKRLGAFLKEENDFREPTEEEWLAELNEKRTRIRGTLKKEVKDPDTGETTVVDDVVGQRIYLPNIIFRMMRNHTPPGQPYNPWEATFRIPQSVTKLDVRSYLHAVYGVQCTYIRTDNYVKPVWRGKMKGHPLRAASSSRKTYKRAVIGLVEPFYYPEAVEDMDLTERQTRDEWIQQQFRINESQEQARQQRLVSWQQRIVPKAFNLTGNRAAILRSVLARRRAREQAVNEGAKSILQSQAA